MRCIYLGGDSDYCEGELVSHLPLMSKGEKENGIAINSKGGY
jgi:hypothetical protein